MSTLLAITLAAAATVQPSCSWDNPGANPYTGNPAAAIDRYTDLPESARVKLKRRIEYGNPDEMVTITRDAITGRHHYDPKIRDMHFGAASVCGSVTRTKWSEKRAEPAAVYCAEDHCILVPKICGNVSRITRLALPGAKPPVAATPAPRPAWDMPDTELGLLDAPPAEPLPAQLPEVVLLSAPVRPVVAAAPPAAPPKDDWYNRPRPIAGGPIGSGVPGTMIRPPVIPSTPGNPVSPVPEPETYAMMLAGLGLVGYLARRKRKQA
nr:MHFG family PEP-CTERM protein [uncultured Duganella sp.]